MITFEDILNKKVAGKSKEARNRTALTDTKLDIAGLKFNGTFSFSTQRLKEEVDLQPFADSAMDAALLKVDELLDDITSQDVFDLDLKRKVRKSGKVKVPKSHIFGLRDKSGRPMNALSLSRLLNITLHTYVKEVMDTGNRLKYKSGRFANSAQVNAINFRDKMDRERKSRVSIMFHYMIAPYSIFEKGGKMHKPGRDPRLIIRDALNLALKDLLSPTSFQNNIIKPKYGGTI